MSDASKTVRSMTGYGQGQTQLGEATIRAEVRTVNGRFLEVRLRLPRELGALEASVRARAARFFVRGRVDLSVRVGGPLSAPKAIRVDLEIAGQYLEAADRLCERFGLEASVPISTLLTQPGVVQQPEPEPDEAEALVAILEAVEQACAQAVGMREREGAALVAEIRQRAEGVEAAVIQIHERADEIKSGLRERLEKRLAALAPELEIDPGRLAQETVLYADRMDVTEETVRLRSHLAQFRETLDAAGSVGRKLEFLLQEIGRETNTIGSKAADAPVGRQIVELKTEIEKLREQALNLE